MEAFGTNCEDVSNRWTTTLIFIVNGAVAVVSFVMTAASDSHNDLVVKLAVVKLSDVPNESTETDD